jgi:hypothetical protein
MIMNWGHKILFVYLAFVAGTLFLVFKSSNQKIDLVTTNYYEKELKYQQTIDAAKRGNSLSEPVKCMIKDNNFIVQFPKDFEGKKLSGQVVLYCPSDEDKDIIHNFSVDDGLVSVPIPAMQNKHYELHLNWLADGINYYFEQKIVI